MGLRAGESQVTQRKCIEADLTFVRSAEAAWGQIAIAYKKQACSVISKTIPDFRTAALSGR
jgi:hypothetical protein